MKRYRLDHLLQDWYQAGMDSAPPQTSERTPECLRFNELQMWETAELPSARRQHALECLWCKRLVRVWQEQSASPKERAPENSAPPGVLSEAMRQFAYEWFRRNEPAADEEAPAYFDASGTFILRLVDMEQDGPVRVRLCADAYRIPVGNFVVKDRTLVVTQPMPDWNLTNLRLAAKSIEVEALAA